MPTKIIDDTTFYYELLGNSSNPPLVLVSGFTCDHTFWQDIIEDLVQNYHILIFDNRAAGQTVDKGSAEVTIQSMAEDTIKLICALGLKMPTIIGHSMGGAIAQVLAASYSNQIEKVCIMHAPAKWRLSVIALIKGTHLSAKQKVDFDCFFQQFLGAMFGEAFIKNVESVENLKKSLFSNQHPQSLENQARQLHALEVYDASGFLDKITVPTTIIYGREDIICNSSDAKALAEKITNAEVQTIELSGAHSPILEAKKELMTHLEHFLAHSKKITSNQQSFFKPFNTDTNLSQSTKQPGTEEVEIKFSNSNFG